MTRKPLTVVDVTKLTNTEFANLETAGFDMGDERHRRVDRVVSLLPPHGTLADYIRIKEALYAR